LFFLALLSFFSSPGVFSNVPCGEVHGFLDSDEGIISLFAVEGSDDVEAHALLAMLYVFLVSHVVVIFDVFFDPEWIRRLRLLAELRRNVHGLKGS
jgi:hypothetical protein